MRHLYLTNDLPLNATNYIGCEDKERGNVAKGTDIITYNFERGHTPEDDERVTEGMYNIDRSTNYPPGASSGGQNIKIRATQVYLYV